LKEKVVNYEKGILINKKMLMFLYQMCDEDKDEEEKDGKTMSIFGHCDLLSLNLTVFEIIKTV